MSIVPAELWKPISGYEGYYEVSNRGRVRGVDRWILWRGQPQFMQGKMLTPGFAANRYMQVTLSMNGVSRPARVHRLVAEAFVNGYRAGLVVCHKDGDTSNNSAANLRWDTQASNMADVVAHGNHATAGTRKTHCLRDHAYTLENTRTDPKTGKRHCRECARILDRRRREPKNLKA